MRFLALPAFLFFISLPVLGQTTNSYGPELIYSLYTEQIAEESIWRGLLIRVSSNDTLVIVRNKSHDEPKPAVFFDKRSSLFIYIENDTLKVYSVPLKKITYSGPAVIRYQPENHYDDQNNLLFFFLQRKESNYVDLIELNLATMKTFFLNSFLTSGDPLTGLPTIIEADQQNRNLLIEIENKNRQTEKVSVMY